MVRYYALVKNARHPEKGHAEARVVHSFGRADKLDRAVLERLVASIRRVLDEADGAPVAGCSGEIEIKTVFEVGVVHVAKTLWERLRIAAAIASKIAEKRLKAPHLAALLAMVVQRLERPGSKLACHARWLEQVWLREAQDFALGQLYRRPAGPGGEALDLLAEHGDAIEQEVFWNSVDLFKLDVDLVFYDATTAWFECDEADVASHEWRGLTFDPLRQRGRSKEGRDNDPQVVIALAVTREGIPVRSWIFPGNTPDVATVKRIKDDLRDMRLGRTLFVGDARLYAKANLEELARGAGKYLLATPMRRITMRGCGDPARHGEIRDEVLSHPGRYAEIAPNLRAKEVVLGDGERWRRYILCLNGGEADRQKWRRAELLETLEAELGALKANHPKRACQLLSSKRCAPYLSQDENGRPYLDRDKFERAEHLDGKFVLTTNPAGPYGPRTTQGDDTLSVADIPLGYSGMWIIESCFRRMKTTGLAGGAAGTPQPRWEVRPMFHWMPQRITAHVKLYVPALMIQRAAERITALTWRQIHDLLAHIKAIYYTAEGRTIVQTSKIRPEAQGVLKKLDISMPKTILDVVRWRTSPKRRRHTPIPGLA